jgi:hypothetical protein
MPTNRQVLGSFAKDFLALFGAMYATAKITVTTVFETGAKAVGAATAIVGAGNIAAGDVFDLLASSYKAGAAQYADTAETAANAAAEAATAAASAALAPDAPPGADAHAISAAEYADAAKAHASESKFWSDQAAKATTAKDIGDALQSAKDEAEQAKEDAKKAQDEAGKAGAAEYKEPSQQPGDESDTSCEDFRRQMWECEQSGWAPGPCEELLNRLNGCPDMTTIYPNPDTGEINCGSVEVDPGTVEKAYRLVCEALVLPSDPDKDPCSPANATGEALTHVPSRGCDPTRAHEGCPTQPPMQVSASVLCPPAPPSAPPPPCIPIAGDPPPMPPPRGFDLLFGADELVITGANGDLDVATLLWESMDWGLGSSATYMVAPPDGWPPSTATA